MHVAVLGSGYVGLVAGACFAETGNDVVCVDKDVGKIERLQRNEIPIYEPGLEDLVRRNQTEGRLRFSTDLTRAVRDAEVIFIAVGTPPNEDGSADLSHVLDVAGEIGRAMNAPRLVVNKSTVPVGTADRVEAAIRAATSCPVDVASNPEFLKEGAAIEDFMRPDRVIIGVQTDAAQATLEALYAPFTRRGGDRFIVMDRRSAELTKYAANAMLATRISFMNQMAALCEALGADVNLVRAGIGSDQRIGRAFLYPGPGYGGSCFPKDVKALVHMAREAKVSADVLEAVEIANARQKMVLLEKTRQHLGADMRESPAIPLVDGLLAAGARVQVHDPRAAETAHAIFGDRVLYAADPYSAAHGADALVIVTEWLMYRNPDLDRLKALLRRPLIVDGRNLFDPARMRGLGFEHVGIGRGHG